MINYFHPIDNYYDDGYYLSPRAQRELRRRRELEFYRLQEEQEEARRAAYELRRREQQHLRELQRRRELEEEEQRQRAYYRTQQEKQRRRRSRREEPVARKTHLSTLEQEDEPPMYQVVQGPDGRLYRIPAVQEEPKVPRRPQYTVMRGPGGRLYRFRTSDSSSDAQQDEEPEPITTTRSRRDRCVEEETSPEQFDPMGIFNEENEPPKDGTKKAQHLGKVGAAHTGRSQQRKNKKRLTVIVEDASDSEMEDDELNSVWRHRRPSPGEWMEPVDN